MQYIEAGYKQNSISPCVCMYTPYSYTREKSFLLFVTCVGIPIRAVFSPSRAAGLIERFAVCLLSAGHAIKPVNGDR